MIVRDLVRGMSEKCSLTNLLASQALAARADLRQPHDYRVCTRNDVRTLPDTRAVASDSAPRISADGETSPSTQCGSMQASVYGPDEGSRLPQMGKHKANDWTQESRTRRALGRD